MSARARKILGQLASYCWIGGVGFGIEAIVLTSLTTLAGANVYLSRLISFTLATAVTWYLNGSYTFHRKADDRNHRSNGREYIRYVLVQMFGGGVNLVVFTFLVLALPRLREIPVIPLAIGAAFGLLVNFTGARLWVYKIDRA